MLERFLWSQTIQKTHLACLENLCHPNPNPNPLWGFSDSNLKQLHHVITPFLDPKPGCYVALSQCQNGGSILHKLLISSQTFCFLPDFQKMLEKQVTKLQDTHGLPEAVETSKYRDWLLKEERPTIQEQENVMRNR